MVRRQDGDPAQMPCPVPSSRERTYVSGRNHKSGMVVTQRDNGGLSIAQGPAYVLVGPDEVRPLIEAIEPTSILSVHEYP
jgi:hypothetical protein